MATRQTGIVSVEVTDGGKLAAIGKAVRKAGADRTLVNNMAKRMRTAAGPVKKEIRESALAILPAREGLNVYVAAAPITVSVRRGARTAGVSLREGRNSTSGKRSELRLIDAGELRHPLWGRRTHWYPQRVLPGFASRVMAGPGGDVFRQAVSTAVDDTIAEIVHGL